MGVIATDDTEDAAEDLTLEKELLDEIIALLTDEALLETGALEEPPAEQFPRLLQTCHCPECCAGLSP